MTLSFGRIPAAILISTHTPHARRDLSHFAPYQKRQIFLLTRLMRGVTEGQEVSCGIPDISTHTPHARRDEPFIVQVNHSGAISTHTPHARRDEINYLTNVIRIDISTHTPHARRDYQIHRPQSLDQISTHTPHARRDRYILYTLALTPQDKRDGLFLIAFIRILSRKHHYCQSLSRRTCLYRQITWGSPKLRL